MKFSIIIPCYNVEKYIARTLDSVLRQTYSNYEVILIDDASTDGTKKVIEKVIKEDKRLFLYFHERNKGVSSARNLGIEKSSGDYVLFLDGDDLIEETLLQDAFKVFQNRDIKIFSYGYKVVEKKFIQINAYTKYSNKVISSKDFLELLINGEIKQCMSSFIVEKKIINNLRFNENLIMEEDKKFQMELMLFKDFLIFYTSDIYFIYLVRENSASNNRIANFKILNTLSAMNNLDLEMKNYGINDFRNYQIINFFSMMNFFSNTPIAAEKFKEVEEKFKKYSFILRDLKFSFKRKEILLYTLKIFYYIDIRFCFFLFRIRKKMNLKLVKGRVLKNTGLHN